MRKIIQFFLIFIFFLDMAGCQRSSYGSNVKQSLIIDDENAMTDSEEDSDEVTVKWMWENLETTDLVKWKRYFIDPISEKYPHIKIDFQPTADHVLVSKIQLASGVGPDLFLVEPADVFNFTREGWLLELDRYVEKYAWDKIIFSWALNTMKIDGNQMAIPHGFEACLLWYNKDLLDANNWPVPRNLEEFSMVCEEAQKKGLIPVSYGSYGMKLYQMWVISDYLSAYAGTDSLEDLLTGRIKFTDPIIKEAMQLYKEHWQKGWYTEKQSFAVSDDYAKELWLNQRALFTPLGSWFSAESRSMNIPFQFGVSFWPSLREGINECIPIGIGAALAVNKNTKHPDEVSEIINFLYSDEQNLASAVADGIQPLARHIDNELYPEKMNPAIKSTLEIMTEANETDKTGYAIWSFFPGRTTIYLYDNIERLFKESISMDEYLAGAQLQLELDFSEGWMFPEGEYYGENY